MVLPEGYTGNCDILFNNITYFEFDRNLLVLWILLTVVNFDVAAEVATHYIYSAALQPEVAQYFPAFYKEVYAVDNGCELKETPDSFSGSITSNKIGGGRGTLDFAQDEWALSRMGLALLSTYTLESARKSMRHYMLDPKRIDFLYRYLDPLGPSHRASFLRYRGMCILSTFSVDAEIFMQPNRRVQIDASKLIALRLTAYIFQIAVYPGG